MISTLSKLLDLLTPQERRRGYLLLCMIVVMALLEVVGVASIMPFMSVLTNPDVIQQNALLKWLYDWLSFSETSEFLRFLGLIVFIALVTSISFKALTTYALLRFTNMRNYSLSRRLVAAYLHQPYGWYLNHHSADLGKTILTEVQHVVQGTIIPFMLLIAHGAVALSLLLLLIIVDPVLALTVAAGLGLVYTIIYLSLRGYLGRIGKERVKANRARFQVVQETFGGIKDVKVSGMETAMLSRYEAPAKSYARCEAASQIATHLPRFAMEIIAFGGMLLVVLYLMSREGRLESALPVIALYGFAGFRLLPALQAVYQHFSHMRFSSAAFESLHKDMKNFMQTKSNLSFPQASMNQSLPLTSSLELENISYTYQGAERPVLSQLSLTIPANTTVAFVGSTGSGKTTTVDIILGLLVPETGSLRVDGNPITEKNLRQWQRAIGYVPQHIFLSDDTIAANIAFGKPAQEIDQQAVEKAAKTANLHDFVIDEMPSGYKTVIGERGIRLSGGQRQRIGIARALYYNPEMLILDEATSALDNLTEQAVMEAVHNLGHRKTIIMIAHRLSTVRECDQIYHLEKGRLVAHGTYDELVSNNKHFRSLAEQGK